MQECTLPNKKMVVYGMGKIGKQILKKLKVHACSQSLSTKERMAWGRTKEILVFRGYKLSPLNQKVMSQNKIFDLLRNCLGVVFNDRAHLRVLG